METENNSNEAAPRFPWLHSWPALIALAAACFRLASPDVPLGLAWGRSIFERGALPATNVFSHMNPDRVVLLDKWLFQLTIYVIHLITGPAGLVCLRVAILGIALFAAAKAAKIRWNWTPHALLAVCFTIALINRCYVRAELVTWAAVPLTLCLMPMIMRGEKKAWALLILLQALWTNSHGYWIVGPMLWLAAGTGILIQPLLERIGWSDGRDGFHPVRTGPSDGEDRIHTGRIILFRLLIAAVVALASACLTPYGLKTIAHPVRLAIELRSDDILARAVDDFGSPLEAIRRGGTIPFWACCAMGLAGIAAAIWLARRRRLDGQKLGIFALALVISMPLYRNFTILALCSLPLVSEWMLQAGGSGSIRTRDQTAWKPSLQGRPRRFLYSLAAIPALLWLGSTFTGWGPATDYGARRPGFGWNTARYPMAAANWLARNMPDAKLWNDFGEGGWLNWRLGEGHTFIDGNTDGYPMDFLKQYHDNWMGIEIQPWFILKNTGIEAALVEHGEGVTELGRFLMGISWLESPSVAYANKQYAVILLSQDSTGADPDLTAQLFRSIARRVSSSIAANRFSLKALTATQPNAPDNMFERSGRLAIWLYPEDPTAQAYYEKTSTRTERHD